MTLRAVGYGRLFSVGAGSASGLIEPVAAVLGVALIGLWEGLLPWSMAAAAGAGAMLFVLTHEVIPETHGDGNGLQATSSLIAGFTLMMVLDTALS